MFVVTRIGINIRFNLLLEFIFNITSFVFQ